MITASEVIYAGGQAMFVFFVAPYIEDSSMIAGAYLIITIPLVLSIVFPERNMKNWNYEDRKWSEETLASYTLRKRIIYGVAAVFNLIAFSFFLVELGNHPISDDYWTEVEKVHGEGVCRDSCRASMAAVSFLMMSISSWLNYIHARNENKFFEGEQATSNPVSSNK